ncbi:MAG: FAD-binding oxidoreductase [Candidatus Neomarinimicrobiota bacterium]
MKERGMSLDKFYATKSNKRLHRWGFKDSGFELTGEKTVTFSGDRYEVSGTVMPDFIPYIESVLGIDFDKKDQISPVDKKPIQPSKLSPEFFDHLKSSFDADRYTVDDMERLIHSHGQETFKDVYKVLYNSIERTVDLVFYPESEDEVKAMVEIAVKFNICLIPYGGGTNVTRALTIPENEERSVVSVDMRRMSKIEWINKEDRRICVQSGITGGELIELLKEEGFTIGHEPDSVELSTVGGWIATNASGMKKNRYGNIEDIVENVNMVSPKGTISQINPISRGSIGFKPQNVLFGSEGNIGIITKAVLKIHQIPKQQKYNSVLFKNWSEGVSFMKALSKTNYIPASVRLVDNIQFRFGQALKPRTEGLKNLKSKIEKFFVVNIKGFDPDKMCALTIVMEGTSEEVAYQQKNVNKLAKTHKGIIGGPGNGKRGYMLTYAIAYVRDFAAKYQIMGETMETTVPWSKIQDVIDATSEKIVHLHNEHNLPGKPYISYRIPQIYHTGVCIYFMLGMSVKGVKSPEEKFSKIEHSLRGTIIKHGGSISHHHGVGKLRKDFIPDMLSKTSIQLIKEMKQSHDPSNVFGSSNGILASDIEE